ncbi:MAG TPA: STAS/SEC14 domain-containing protein [Marinobacter sp.]|nr:STAS/SEC14 domain-containing protein [Marinobacter sp.]
MIETYVVPGTNIVSMSVEGSISAPEFDNALAVFKQAIDEHGSIRVLERIGALGMPPVPWSRFWADIRFGFAHLGDISHVAVVSDHRWISAWVGMLGPLLKPEVQMFSLEEEDKARKWLETAT